MTPPEPDLIDDGDGFSIWSKPAGLMSGGSRFGDHCAIDRVVSKKLDRQTYIVHRLDHFTWGLMVLAYDRKSAAGITTQFQALSVGKTHQPIIHGDLQDTLQIDAPIEGKPASSIATPVARDQGRTLTAVAIKTGRKHQIRVHLSEKGYPIVGDRQYGSTDKADLQLASVELSFADPLTGAQLTYSLAEDQRPALYL